MTWTVLITAVAVVAITWAALVGVLLLAGRRSEAAAATRFVPDCLVLFKRLLGDERVPRTRKVAIAALVAYLAMPFDLVPDFLPVVGQLDDAILVVLVLRFVLRAAGPGLIAEHWPGPETSSAALTRLTAGRQRRSRPRDV